MAAACEMMVEENDIELSLGLSLGGCFRKSEGIRQKSVVSCAINGRSGENEVDLRSSVSLISAAPVFGENKEVEIGGEVMDPQKKCGGFREEEEIQIEGEVLNMQRKRKIQALRRQEARQKRDEKQQKKRIVRGGRNGSYLNGNVPMRTDSMDEKMLSEAQEYQSRVQDQDSVENETNRSEQICKKAKVTDEEDQHDVNQTSKQCQRPNASSAFVPVVPMQQYPFPHLQYVPFANGFAIPYSVPYWTAPPPASAAVGDEKNVFQPAACGAFRPFQAKNSIANQKSSGSSNSEQNGTKSIGLKQVQSSLCSSGSLGSCSSGISDYPSTSHQGNGSSDTRSNSSRLTSEQPQLHTTIVNNAQGQTEHSASSSHGIEEPEQNAEKLVASSPFQTNPEKTEGKSISINKPITPPRSPNQPPRPLKVAKAEANKPPKPPQHQPIKTQSLAHMPCVTTTGNGPNGKTITGFLYRYNKTEVSILCVCHGSFFTPAEFVKHAGGTEVLHPLKHIVVVPSPF
ncbi:hypothetical protein NE237_012716 [Protea cynaroides]|uniref:Ninja-family protein n=1 Tax=Protea cynaroides TaxID=273540 RepID=A0A9Q0GY00_9MAGN|nr:hypothetical protein NE237_012716 [Protea cynaroides]